MLLILNPYLCCSVKNIPSDLKYFEVLFLFRSCALYQGKPTCWATGTTVKVVQNISVLIKNLCLQNRKYINFYFETHIRRVDDIYELKVIRYGLEISFCMETKTPLS